VPAEALKTTPLKDEHLKLRAKMVPFGGWLMPVQYSGIVDEHRTVRSAVGIFDISHMGQFVVSGNAARNWLNRMLTNDVAKLGVGTGQYTFLLNDRGGVIDDLIVYRTGDEEFFLVVNAARVDEDFDWLQKHKSPHLELRNCSPHFGAVAIQGPRATEFFRAWRGNDKEPPVRNQIADFTFSDNAISVARTGYTGEDGFEVFFPAEIATELWQDALATGGKFGMKPCAIRLKLGLGSSLTWKNRISSVAHHCSRQKPKAHGTD
jgi:aminomethyltransferase